MASELRVNKLTNRSGLGTVTYTDTGVIVSGIVTANSFSGGLPITSGADNRVITASSASAIQGEANLTYDGTNMLINGTMLNAVQLKFGNSGTAYIDHNIVGQDLQFRVGNSSALDFTAISIDSSAQQTKFRKQIVVGLQGGNDVTTIGGGSGIGAYIQLDHASSGTNSKLMGNSDSWLNANHGNLGIGTANPQSRKLHVLGTTRPVEIGSTNATNIVKLYNSATGRATYNGFDITASSTDGGKINVYGGSIMFGTSASNGSDVTERLRIHSNGNMSLGSTSAPTKFGIRGTSASTDATLQIVGNSVSTLLLGQDADGGVIRGQGGNNALKFKVGGGGDTAATTGGTEAVRINSSGNVGIGSLSPTGKFDIALGGNSFAKFGQDADNPKMEMFRSTGNASNTHYGAELQLLTGDFVFSNAPGADLGSHSYTERLRIKSNGYVGVGQATPASRLHVSESGSNTINIQLTNATTGHTYGSDGMTIGYSSNSNVGFINVAEGSGGFLIKTGGTGTSNERLRIDSSGRLLINQTAGDGDNKLQISGNNDDRVQIRIKRTNAIGANAVYGGLDIVDNNNADVASIRAHNEAGATASYFSFKNYTSGGSLSEKLRITSKGLLELVSGEGLKLNPYVSGQYALNGTLSYYATNNAVYLNGAGPDGWLRLNGAGTENNRNCINIYGSNHSSGDQLAFRVASNTRLAMRNSEHCVHVQGDTAATGTNHGSKGFSIQTGGGTSCPIYFGSETNVAQKSMYLNGYWIYLRGHVNEGMRFIFSQGSGAPHNDYYQFKYNSATRPGGSNTWDGFSDVRAKENVQSITNGIEKIKQLRPVTYDWTNDYADSTGMYIMKDSAAHKENGYDTDMKNGRYGFIAQEYETVLPKDVKQDKFTLGDTEISDFRTINHDSLIPTLTAALKEAIAKIEVLETEVAALKGS